MTKKAKGGKKKAGKKKKPSEKTNKKTGAKKRGGKRRVRSGDVKRVASKKRRSRKKTAPRKKPQLPASTPKKTELAKSKMVRENHHGVTTSSETYGLTGREGEEADLEVEKILLEEDGSFGLPEGAFGSEVGFSGKLDSDEEDGDGATGTK